MIGIMKEDKDHSLVFILIVNCNGKKFLWRCLASGLMNKGLISNDAQFIAKNLKLRVSLL